MKIHSFPKFVFVSVAFSFVFLAASVGHVSAAGYISSPNYVVIGQFLAAPSYTLSGSGFDPVASNNIIQFDEYGSEGFISTSTSIYVTATAVTPTSLTFVPPTNMRLGGFLVSVKDLADGSVSAAQPFIVFPTTILANLTPTSATTGTITSSQGLLLAIKSNTFNEPPANGGLTDIGTFEPPYYSNGSTDTVTFTPVSGGASVTAPTYNFGSAASILRVIVPPSLAIGNYTVSVTSVTDVNYTYFGGCSYGYEGYYTVGWHICTTPLKTTDSMTQVSNSLPFSVVAGAVGGGSGGGSGGSGSGSGSGSGESNTQTNGDVTLTNLTGPSASIFTVGDNWKVVVTDPQAPNAKVWLFGGQNGNYNNVNPAGTTDSTGTLTLTGQMTASQVGTWAELWKVGATSGTAVSIGSLGFVVESASGSGVSSGLPGQPIGFTTTIKGDGTSLTTQKQLIDQMNNLESTYLSQYETGTGIENQIQRNILSMLTVPSLPTQSATTTPSGGSGDSCSGTSPTPLVADLQTGDFGDEVTLLTQVLVTDGEMTTTQGIFDQTVFNAVVAYQNKYAAEILTPSGLTQGTGYVGTATKNFMNNHWCAPGGSSGGGVGTIPVISGASFATNGAGQDIVTVTGTGFNSTASENQINIGSQSVPASSVITDPTTGAPTAVTADVSGLNLSPTLSYSVTVTNLGL